MYACTVQSDRHLPPVEAELTQVVDDDSSSVSPLGFVIAEHEDGMQTLELREGEFEQVYRLREVHSCTLFIALCRREGVPVYRRPRQHEATLSVRTTLSKHDALWARFFVLSRSLDPRLAAVVQQFVREELRREEP